MRKVLEQLNYHRFYKKLGKDAEKAVANVVEDALVPSNNSGE